MIFSMLHKHAQLRGHKRTHTHEDTKLNFTREWVRTENNNNNTNKWENLFALAEAAQNKEHKTFK